MPKPIPQPIKKEELPELAQSCMRSAKFPFLATVDEDQPRLRPVSPVRVDGFTVYIANLRQYSKTKELAENPKVEICYLDSGHDQVRITGQVEIVDDQSLLQEIWDENPLLKHYLGKPDNPDLIIYKVIPDQVRFMREWALEYYDIELS